MNQTNSKSNLDKLYNQEYERIKSLLIQKLTQMKEHIWSRKCLNIVSLRSVVNISNWQLSSSEESILNKSLKIVTAIKWDPHLDIIARIEEIDLKMN